MSGVRFLLADAHGQYIPQVFCKDFDPTAWGFPVLVERFSERDLDLIEERVAMEADEIGMSERDREAYIEVRVEALTCLPDWRSPDDDWDTCLIGPDQEFYWESWDEILSHAVHTDANGNKWMLHQDGDLWCYCVELMTDEEKTNFGFEIIA